MRPQPQHPHDNSFDGLLLFGAILVGLWFVPDVVRLPLVFPFQTISERSGADLVGAVMPPVSGAIFLLLFALRPPLRVRFTLAAVVSIEAIFAVLFGSGDFFFLSPTLSTAILASALGIAIFVRRRIKSDKVLLAAAALMPLAYFVYALAGEGKAFAYVWPFKAGIALFAATAEAAISISRLLERYTANGHKLRFFGGSERR